MSEALHSLQVGLSLTHPLRTCRNMPSQVRLGSVSAVKPKVVVWKCREQWLVPVWNYRFWNHIQLYILFFLGGVQSFLYFILIWPSSFLLVCYWFLCFFFCLRGQASSSTDFIRRYPRGLTLPSLSCSSAPLFVAWCWCFLILIVVAK